MTKARCIEVNVGDHVLIGASGVTMPTDWFITHVLWIGRGEVLAHHTTDTVPEGYRQIFNFDQIVAVGDIHTLNELRNRCCNAVKEQQRLVRELESQLQTARNNVWDVLTDVRRAAI